MTAQLTWADLPGRSVAVWGVGVEGLASLRRLRADGVEPVLVDREPKVFDDGTEVRAYAEGGQELLNGVDVVVKSPGISRYGSECADLVAAGVDVVGGLGLWLNGADRSRVACITGTKGKSTTTAVAGGLLAGLGVSHRVGGNIGTCPWDPDVPQDVDWWVVETSSYQALDVQAGPAVVAVTSLGEDHLPWHGGSVENYHRDKLSLCTRPGVRAVVASDEPSLRERADWLGSHVDWVAERAHWAAASALLGEHNLRNAEVARRTLLALGVPGADDEDALAEALAEFAPLPHRLTAVAHADDVAFVDDSISTNPLSAVAAVRAFPGRRVALLVGGLERDVDYRPLAACVDDRVRVFTMPSNGSRIGEVLRAEGVQQVEDCASLPDAVRRGFAWARPGGVVLLSPAAASFDLFADYRARGEAFCALARELCEGESRTG
ncbi:MAG TPA: UDP-N-acetylmuramoyl-L-alanine--D-glutamate ligase [Motilibacteraceae bacterium]|nr:UDP-N-acetylmuramoyl-L-alanine--D-glutamate ligase [Motilibacteraceae bacterium]